VSRNKLDDKVQLLIPPALILLMVVTIFELFYELSLGWRFLIDIFDLFVVAIFAIDLYYRWFESKTLVEYLKKHWIDIIATIPFSLIFLYHDGVALTRGLRGVRIAREAVLAARIAKVSRTAKIARYGRLLRLLRFGARAPRFLRARKHIKKVPIRKVQPHEKEMKGVLSFRVILLITINSIMGTGIWFLTATGAKHAGPASLVSWAVLSIISLYIAMCFSELTSMFPKAGGVYEFAKQAYGRFWSFVIGWTTSIAGSVTIAMLLLGALQYIIPQYPNWYIPLAISLILLFNYIAYRGMQTSTVMLVSFALITLGTVSLVIFPGLFKINPGNFEPFFVLPTFSIVITIFFIAETFFGWESAIFLSAETKDPTKVMPKALIYGTLIIAVLALLLSFTAMGLIPWQQYAESVTPLSDLGGALFGTAGNYILTILVFVSIIGAVACWVVTAPRLLMSIAEDKLFFVQFAKIHPKNKSPYVSILFQVVVLSILVIVGAGSYETLLHMLIPLILLVYSAILMSVVILRYKKPDVKRPFKVPFGKVGPVFTAIFMFFLLFMFAKETHGAFDILRISGSLIMFGLPAYFFIELFYEQKYIDLRKDFIAKILHHMHKVPHRASYSQILEHIGDTKKNDVVVDYNSPVGAIARLMIKRGMKFKTVNVANTSREELNYLRELVHKHNVVSKRVREGKVPIKNADVFVSFNDLADVSDMEKFLKEVSKSLKKGGRFCFYVTHNFINVAVNALVIEKEKEMIEIFKKYKLNAKYSKTKHLLREKIFIYGVKK
jgi:basic amino acid/polyamine antiporter, APA family